MFDKRFAMNKRQQITNPYQNAPLFMTENTKKKLDGDQDKDFIQPEIASLIIKDNE